jgi:hypothetical protein
VGGEINAQTDGNFGEFIIDKGMTVDGRGHSVSITAFGNGINVNAPASRVTIRNLHIQGFEGAGDGIQVTSVAHLRLRDVTIRTMDGHGVDFRDPGVPSRLTVLDSSISEGERQGIAVAPSATGAAGAYKRVVVRNSDISANSGSGIWTGPGAPATANPLVIGVFDSTLADNGGQGLLSDGANTRMRIAENVITGNIGFGIRAINGGQIISYGNNRIYENGTNGPPTSVVPQN